MAELLALHFIHRAQRGRGSGCFDISALPNKRRNAGLGSYPEVGIAEAGKKALIFREQLTQWLDPLELKAEAALAESNQSSLPLFQNAAEKAHTELKPGRKNPKPVQQWINPIRAYAVPVSGVEL
ncbi:MAG: hypothetical protein ACYC3A_09975 [Halothiobacillus sp.]